MVTEARVAEIILRPGQQIIIRAAFPRVRKADNVLPSTLTEALRKSVEDNYETHIRYLPGGNPDAKVNFLIEQGKQLVPLAQALRQAKEEGCP